MALPKLNLRDLFWLVLVMAMGLGWWLDWGETVHLADRMKTLEAEGESLKELVAKLEAENMRLQMKRSRDHASGSLLFGR